METASTLSPFAPKIGESFSYDRKTVFEEKLKPLIKDYAADPKPTKWQGMAKEFSQAVSDQSNLEINRLAEQIKNAFTREQQAKEYRENAYKIQEQHENKYRAIKEILCDELSQNVEKWITEPHCHNPEFCRGYKALLDKLKLALQ